MNILSFARRLAAISALAATNLAPIAASAQVIVQDPTVAAIQTKIAGVQTAMAQVQNNQYLTEAQSTAQLVQQVQTMIQDHVNVGTIVNGQGNQLLANVSSNVQMFNSEIGVDQNVLNHFQALVPSFTGQMDYAAYLQQLRQNQFNVYAANLGVANNEIQSLPQVQAALQALANTPANNQLQALQELVVIGKTQVNEISSLLKIQGAMLKDMSVAYQAGMQNGFGSSSLAAENQNLAGARARCALTNPFIGYESTTDQQAALARCQAAIPAQAQ